MTRWLAGWMVGDVFISTHRYFTNRDDAVDYAASSPYPQYGAAPAAAEVRFESLHAPYTRATL